MKHRRLSLPIACVLAITIASLILAVRAFGSGQTETTLYAFAGGTSDGSNSAAPVVFDRAGNLYGTTQVGGQFGNGTVFELTPPTTTGGAWTESVLYSFASGPNDGGVPTSGVILDGKGALYGETNYGGTSNAGTVFKLMPPAAQGSSWTETILYNFCGTGNPCSTGAWPSGGLVFDKKGNLYGTAQIGGNPNTGCCGVVFELTKPHGNQKAWTETVLYVFSGGIDGYRPETGVIFDKFGNLYGTTHFGGNSSACSQGCGVVFELTSGAGTWAESVLYSFQGTSDGYHPGAGLVLDKLGALYGTTGRGGNPDNGTVFRLTPPPTQGAAWTESVLYAFQGFNRVPADGDNPGSGVILVGKDLYGTTAAGGSNYCSYNGSGNNAGCGTAYKLTPPKSGTGAWTEKILWDAASSDTDGGHYPAAALNFKNGAFYSTTGAIIGPAGGCQLGCGAVFKLVR